MPIEIEATKGMGYDKIDCNISSSSFTDQKLCDLDISINDTLLLYGVHKGKSELCDLLMEGIELTSYDILITSGAASTLFIASDRKAIFISLLQKEMTLVVPPSNDGNSVEHHINKHHVIARKRTAQRLYTLTTQSISKER